MSLLPTATMANKGTDYFGRRETDVRLEALITKLQAQIQIVEESARRLEDADKTLGTAIDAVKDTAQTALASAKQVDAELTNMRDSTKQIEQEIASIKQTANNALMIANRTQQYQACMTYCGRRNGRGLSLL